MGLTKRVALRLLNKVRSTKQERHLANAFIAVILMLSGVYLLLDGDFGLGSFILCFSGAYLAVTTQSFRMSRDFHKQGVSAASVLSEISLTLLMYVLMLTNLVVAYSAYLYGSSRLGVLVLSLSLAVQILSAWKRRFAFLVAILIIGAALIELA